MKPGMQASGTALQLFIGLVFSLALFGLGGCSQAPPVANSANANTNRPVASTQPTPAAGGADKPVAPRSPGGDPIDTTALDAEVTRAEKELKQKPQDSGARLALANAYASRGNALTEARQYRAALGDYRRALKHDPENKDARQMSGTIIGILQSMGRDVPAEGTEPGPLPFKKEDAGDGGGKKSY